MGLTRRQFNLSAGVLALAPSAFARTGGEETVAAPPLTRPIPSSGERIPAVGLGTAAVFDRNYGRARQVADGVVRALIAGGGRLIDTASTYRDAESVLGDTLDAAQLREKIFIATKLERPDAAELQQSLTRLKTAQVDLLQMHNVSEPSQSLAQFRDWKAQGLCRYTGITSTYHDAFEAIEQVLVRERPDFVQVDYSIDDREVERRILPLAAEHGCAVLTALPFGRGRLLRAVQDKALPDWAHSFAETWPQYFLKYLLADERITAAIPGTSNPAHMSENLGALRGRLPDAAERARMVDLLATL